MWFVCSVEFGYSFVAEIPQQRQESQSGANYKKARVFEEGGSCTLAQSQPKSWQTLTSHTNDVCAWIMLTNTYSGPLDGEKIIVKSDIYSLNEVWNSRMNRLMIKVNQNFAKIETCHSFSNRMDWKFVQQLIKLHQV